MSKEPLYYFKLAKSMHDEYEKHSKTIGWKTQDSCQVKFKDLPLNNQKVMLHLAKFVDNKVGLATLKEMINEWTRTHELSMEYGKGIIGYNQWMEYLNKLGTEAGERGCDKQKTDKGETT